MGATMPRPGEPIETVSGRGLPLPGDDIDTDRIIPARFLKCVTFDGLGAQVFWDERHTPDGTRTGHPLDDPRFEGARVLIVGANFGCGSSREHAPQALRRAGFAAIVGESFGEIFAGNALTLGLVCATASRAELAPLRDELEAAPTTELVLDVAGRVLEGASTPVALALDPSAAEALLSGQWDPLTQLLSTPEAVARTAAALPYAGWRSRAAG